MGLKTYNPHIFLRKTVEFPETKAWFKPRSSMPVIWIFLEEHIRIRYFSASVFNISPINIMQVEKLLLFDYNCTSQFVVTRVLTSPLCNSKGKEKKSGFVIKRVDASFLLGVCIHKIIALKVNVKCNFNETN